jgi:hypothetical protein
VKQSLFAVDFYRDSSVFYLICTATSRAQQIIRVYSFCTFILDYCSPTGLMHTKSKGLPTPNARTGHLTSGYGGFSFKKRKPQPGKYPLHFSPYTLENTTNSPAVSLARCEIRSDLEAIGQGMRNEFMSRYFDEIMPMMDNQDQPANLHMNSLAVQRKNLLHSSRRNTLSRIQAPSTEAEERRQIKAAIKASRFQSTLDIITPFESAVKKETLAQGLGHNGPTASASTSHLVLLYEQ